MGSLISCCCDESDESNELNKLNEPNELNKNNFIEQFFLKCKTIDEIDNFIIKYNYKINEYNIYNACKLNIPINFILHLMTYKINFNYEIVSLIIKLYQNNNNNNNNVIQILSTIRLYGYEYTSQNYTEILKMKYFSEIFSEFVFNCRYKNILIINESFIDVLYLKHNTCEYKKYYEFLEKLCDFVIEDKNLSNVNLLKLFCEKLKKLYLSDKYNTNAITTKKKYINRILNKFNLFITLFQ